MVKAKKTIRQIINNSARHVKEFFGYYGDKILIGLAGTALIGIGGTIITLSVKADIERNSKFNELTEVLSEKISADLLAQDKYKINDLDNVAIQYMSFETKNKTKVSTENKSGLTIYGISTQMQNSQNKLVDKSFKMHYSLPKDLDVSYSVKSMQNLEDALLNTELDYISFNDVSALTLGFESDSDIKSFSNSIGKVQNEYKTPDLFYPIYSSVSLTNNDGKNYVVMELEGLNSYNKKESNVAMGILAASYTYQTGSTNGSTPNMGYVVANGLVASELFSTKSVENYFSRQTFTIELEDDMDYSESQLREYVIDAINSENKNLQTDLKFYSNKLNDLDSKLNKTSKNIQLKTNNNDEIL